MNNIINKSKIPALLPVAVDDRLAPFEQIRKFRILEREFSIEKGELTPTMKVRRNRVLENHREIVSELYMGKEESQ